MKRTLLKPLTFLLLFGVFSCAKDQQKVVSDSSMLQPTHGGKLIKGEEFFVEVVGTEDKVELYPMDYNKKTGKLESLPADKVDIHATYSFLHHEPEEGVDGRPTMKSESTIPLEKVGDGFEGPVKAENMEEYVVRFNVRYKSDKESYRHEVQL